MSELPFGIESKSTYASLSPADLQSLGKRASAAYLAGGTSLNEAVIKLAREHASISPHQVQRVVEFANQETYSRLFADNEKYASNKNIVFEVADPGVILRDLNNGASPTTMSASSGDFARGPIKLAHQAVEADLALTQMFLGVDFGYQDEPAMMKVKMAKDGSIDRILSMTKVSEDDPLDRILSVGKTKSAFGMGSGNIPMGAMDPNAAPQQAAMPTDMPLQTGSGPGAEDNPEGHHEAMLEVQREIELAKKRQELQKIQQQSLDAMAPEQPAGAAPAPGPAGPEEEQVAQGQEGGPVEMAAPQEEIPPAAAGAITAPPGEGVKMGSVKTAMAYAKSGRPHGDLILKDLSGALSLGKLKAAVASKDSYPMANPHGELIRQKQKCARVLEDATHARGKTKELYKEATEQLESAVVQHLWGGGNLGEVAQLMGSVNGGYAKLAFETMVPSLIDKGLDLKDAQARAIAYEMVKGASARAPNTSHPVAQAYGAFCKVAEGLRVIEESWHQANAQHEKAARALQKVMVSHASSL